MAAAAHDDDVIFLLGLRLPPGGLPVLVAGEGIPEKREYIVAHALVLKLMASYVGAGGARVLQRKASF
jgi:hypothetical protein